MACKRRHCWTGHLHSTPLRYRCVNPCRLSHSARHVLHCQSLPGISRVGIASERFFSSASGRCCSDWAEVCRCCFRSNRFANFSCCLSLRCCSVCFFLNDCGPRPPIVLLKVVQRRLRCADGLQQGDRPLPTISSSSTTSFNPSAAGELFAVSGYVPHQSCPRMHSWRNERSAEGGDPADSSVESVFRVY